MPSFFCRSVLSLLFSSLLHSAFAQNDLPACQNVKEGIYYSYPTNVNDNWKSVRKGDLQQEINLTTNDTILFQVSWPDQCQYSLKYKSGGKKLGRDVLAMFKQYAFVSVITQATPEYYVTTSYLESPKNYPIAIDTMWNAERKVSSDRVVFRALSPAEQRKAKLKDTSSFALLYVYRPSKFICSGVSFPLYGNDVLMCGFPEKGGAYVFKVQKQGLVRLTGQHRQNKDYLDVDIRFGQKYYVRVDTKWSLSRCIPFLTEKDKVKGEEEFIESQY
jgi:hypothetical protein